MAQLEAIGKTQREKLVMMPKSMPGMTQIEFAIEKVVRHIQKKCTIKPTVLENVQIAGIV